MDSSSEAVGSFHEAFFVVENDVGYRFSPGASHDGAAVTLAVCHCLDIAGLAASGAGPVGSSMLSGR